MEKLIWGLAIAFGVIAFISFLLWQKSSGYKISMKGYLPKYPGTWKIIGLIFAGGAIYGIYLIVYSYTPPKSERLFKQVVEKQKAQEIAPLLEKLGEIAGGTSTAAAIGEAKGIKDSIEAIEKKYDKILDPESVKAPPPPSVYVEWFLEVKATSALIESYERQKPLIQRPVASIIWDKNKMSLKYLAKSDGKEREIVLERDAPEQFFAGYYWNSDTRKNSVLWLKEPQDGIVKKFESYDQIKNQKVVRETLFTGWMSKTSRGDTMDAEVSIIKQTTTAASKN
ncbi:MAG: hypothetical protein L6Q29_00485 [Candidatus Pacebacteria bacterium]|nr:hypothetical protein [Candidatus Paceibacterota bacterium]